MSFPILGQSRTPPHLSSLHRDRWGGTQSLPGTHWVECPLARSAVFSHWLTQTFSGDFTQGLAGKVPANVCIGTFGNIWEHLRSPLENVRKLSESISYILKENSSLYFLPCPFFCSVNLCVCHQDYAKKPYWTVLHKTWGKEGTWARN